MKTYFKPLGVAAAVAAVTAGYAGVASAQSVTRSIGNTGDLAIIPYYTVQDDWVTGVHITNTSDFTRVVKLRLRRGSDSADALDFNLIMSPYDVWTGFLDDSSGNVVFQTDDNTCTAPALPNGQAVMPAIFAAGAEEGYIEVIPMGRTINELQPIAIAAKHSNGVPADCAAVRSNFFKNQSFGAASDPSKKGVIDAATTHQTVASMAAFNAQNDCVSPANVPYAASTPPAAPDAPGVCQSNYTDGGNGLSVSYFFRDATSGIEFGGNAVHMSNFSTEAWITNQETGLFSGDLVGFDYPGLDGGPVGTTRGLYNTLRDTSVLGVARIINDWSVNAALGVSTDWVVTLPGQHTMLDYAVWAGAGFDPANCGKLDDPTVAGDQSVPQCDFRDIPVEASVDLWNREEGVIIAEEGDLVISPAPPGVENKIIFPTEVNVVHWSDGSNDVVLTSDYATTIDPTPVGIYGWAQLSVSATKKTATDNGAPSPTANSNGQAVCQFWFEPPVPGGVGATQGHEMRQGGVPFYDGNVCEPANTPIPIVGFVAWERSFPANPDANYGRLIDHSFTSM